MADIRVVGDRREIELVARRLGCAAPRFRKRRDGGVSGYFSYEPKTICLDTETTGLCPWGEEPDEILTLSIVDMDGNVLHDGKYKPVHKTEWPGAARINGIWPEDVADYPWIYDDGDKIREIIWSADEIVAYNASFDLRFLKAVGMGPLDHTLITDTMLEYAELIGEWDDYHEGWKWHKLVNAAAHIGYEWTGKAHGSLADALATVAVQKWVEEKRREDAEDE